MSIEKNREGRYNQDLQDRQILSQKEKSKVKSRTDLKIQCISKKCSNRKFINEISFYFLC